jgi:hypothetical protein
MHSRRNFIKTNALACAAALSGGVFRPSPSCRPGRSKITVKSDRSAFEREPLIRPFEFKGVYVNELWQSAVLIESSRGSRHVGLQTHGLAWSDINVFSAHSEAEGNLLIIKTFDYALRQIKGQSFTNPNELLDEILMDVHKYGHSITGTPNLRMTFTFSSLVALDNAL